MIPTLLRRKGAMAAVAVGLAIPLGLVTYAGATSASPAAPAAVTPAASGFGVAPYVDMSNNQEPMLDKAISGAGLKAFTAAFVIGSNCTAIWGDTLPVTNDPMISGEISKAQAAGVQAIVSFGGAGGVELAQSCTNTAQLTAAYQTVINQYHLTHIDFDVEGAAIADTASIDRRFAAIASLESANAGLVVSVTIPTFPTGPDFNGDNFLQAAKKDGARIDMINVMAMDYYGTFDQNPTMGAYAVQAAQNTLAFVKTVWPSDTYANIGVTPMIGRNDDAAETFSQSDAQSLVSFANANGLGRLSFWSVDRDQPCAGSANGLPSCSETSQASLDYSKIFNGFSGGGTPPTTTTTRTTSTTSAPPTTTTGGNGGTCPSIAAWSASTAYVPNDVVSFNGHKWTSLYFSTGVTPGSPIAWNIWRDNGAC